MCTPLTNGRALNCYNEAGINKVWIANHSTDATFTTDSTGYYISGATSAETAYFFATDTAHSGLNFTSDISAENGAISKNYVLSLKLIGMDKELLATLAVLERSALTAYVQTNDGKYYALASGARPARVTSSTGGSGTALTDLRGAELEITVSDLNAGLREIDGTLLGTDIAVSN